jgi:excisionase family DNA binding protein
VNRAARSEPATRIQGVPRYTPNTPLIRFGQRFACDIVTPRWNRPVGLVVVFVVFPAHHKGVDVTDPITTGEAAKIIGCSRQHVVDMCDDGKLSVVRKGGSHRYVSRSQVLALTSRPGTREQEQSRWLHGAVAGHLVKDPDLVLSRALENLDRFSEVHAGTMAGYWLRLWRDALRSGPDLVLDVLVADTPQAREMRQNSPFTGILPGAERVAVLRSFRQHWRAKHVQ